ncbi:hypothetical protein SAMN04488008_103102 [Maribacter orientalis]|uniref:Uncharacterized protein n=1 Tax=Maribacter orientalis TaxID=228957 RepID=A0A1H7N819_9FLAO|nr:hypothetical protein [Maribacter orientalis]SEL19431.1 hypothetical protein SAMN04488008_103102 [Maribacter orientalis]
MAFKLSRTFFVPLASIIFLLSLSSCGKDHDLISEYVIRDANLQVQLNTTQDNNLQNVALVSTSTTNEVKKK